MKHDTDSHSRLIVAALVLAMLASLAGGVWFFRSQQHAMRTEIEKNLGAIARIKADQIVAWRKDQLADAAMHAHPFMLESVARFLSEPTENNRRDLLTRFRALAQQHDYANVLLVGPDGKIRLRLSDSETLHHGYLSALDTALRERKPVFVDLHFEPDHKTPHISVVAPLWAADDQAQKPLGALVFITNASQFLFPLIQSWPIPGDTAETLLVRRDGDHVLFLNNLRHAPGTALNLRIPLSRTDLPAVTAVKGEKGFVQGRDYRGADVAAVILPIPESPWFMVSKIDAEEAFADWRSRSFLLLVMIFAWTALVGVVGLVFWQRAKKVHFRALYRFEADLRAQMERHSVTLKAVGDAVIAADARGRVELLNPVAESLTGWRQDDAVGKALEEVFHIINARTREKAENPVARVLREGLVVGLANHTILISKNGTEYQIADSAAPITDPTGDITGVVMVFRDVTGEYAMQQALVDAERYYRSLIHSLHEDILVIDRDYRVTDINNSALQTLGLNRDQAMGRQCYGLSHGLDAPCHMHGEECGLRHVLETGTDCNLHHEHVDADGNRRHVDILTSPLKDQTGNITHVIEAVRDVTDLFESRNAADKAEDALIGSEKRYRRLFEAAKDGILILDANTGKIVDVNPYLLQLLGCQPDGLLGKYLWELSPFATIAASKDAFETLKQKEYIRYDHLPLETVDGEIVEVEFVSNVYRVDHAKVIQCNIRDITERRRADAERERLLSAIEQADEMIVITHPDGAIQYVNPAFERVTGYARNEVIGQNPRILKSGKQDPDFYRNLWETLSGGNTFKGRMVNKRKDGTFFTEEATISPVHDPSGRIVNYVAVKHDITEHLRLVAQFQQAQKMESVGRLAGGVAHDYNNMLGVIIGFTEIALEKAASDASLQADLRQVLDAAHRSTDITRQLLAFARRQTIAPKVLDLNETVEEMLKMLRRLIGEDIDLSWQPGPYPMPVFMDPSQVDQILANLCVNARDAIGGVGKITIETGRVCFDAEYCADHAGFIPGDFILLALSDDGCGMDRNTLDNIFEPFFTTKDVGEGTGLGLATVYGIVKQNEGFINVYSEPGKGTTFRIYLPCHGEGATKVPAGEAAETRKGRGETVLVVEDEAAILKLAQRVLEGLGYRVLAASTPGNAAALARAHAGRIHLLITDVVMPEMNGMDLSEDLRAQHPDLKVLFMSGYTANVIAHRGVLDEGVNFIQKPFSNRDFAVKVREALKGK